MTDLVPVRGSAKGWSVPFTGIAGQTRPQPFRFLQPFPSDYEIESRQLAAALLISTVS